MVPQYRINGTQISSANFSDGTDLTKDDEVNAATTIALSDKMQTAFSNVGSNMLPDTNIPSTITRDSEAVLLAGNQTILGQKLFNDAVYINSTKTLISTIAGGGGEAEYVASRVGQPSLNSLNTMFFASPPANTQKTVAYLENTRQTGFAGALRTPMQWKPTLGGWPRDNNRLG